MSASISSHEIEDTLRRTGGVKATLEQELAFQEMVKRTDRISRAYTQHLRLALDALRNAREVLIVELERRADAAG